MSALRMSILAVSCVLAGCHGKTITQTDCESSTQTYAELSSCLKVAVDRMYTPRPQYAPELNLYLMKSAELAERVKADATSDFNGRVELQALYVTLREQKAAR